MKNARKISTGFAVVSFLIFVGIAHADIGQGNHQLFVRPIVGVVTAVNDNDLIIGVIDAQGSSTAIITNYTVETHNARILKLGTTILVGSIQINDKIVVIGTVSGTNITAKVIFDGVLPLVRGPPVDKEAV